MPSSRYCAKFSAFFRSFSNDQNGAIAILFGLSVTVLVLITGIAIDSSRVLHTSSRVQRALDTAAIAAARKMDSESITTSQIQAAAQKYFDEQVTAQLIDNVGFANFTANPNFSTGTVVVSVDVQMPLYFAAVAKTSPNKNKSMSSAATYKPKKLEIALVVDVTGSMCDSSPCASGTKLDALKSAAKNMVDQLHSANPSNGAVRFSLVPYSASVNAGSLSNLASNGASTDNCVVERKGSGARTNEPPGAGRYFEVSSSAQNSNYSCPTSTIVPLTEIGESTQRATFKASIDGLEASGATAGHIGLGWGWYTVSPEWNATFTSGKDARAYDPDNTLKAVVLMTDGIFNTAYNNGGENFVEGDASRLDRTKPGSSGYQALQLCETMKNPADSNKAIEIYTIAFQAPTEAQELLKECGGVPKFFEANNASDLNDAFKSIAEELSKLRISS